MAKSSASVRRLMAALSIHRSWVDQGGGDSEALLARHADLRDLLEPMLADAAGAERDESDESDGATEATLGRYLLREELGRGGMGVVRLAWHPDLRREVALKTLPPHQSLNPRAVARFRREASAMARLEHRGIVSVFEVGFDREQHFLAMERLHGRTLEQEITARAGKGAGETGWQRQVLQWCVQLCDALSYAHSRGVLHRDLKPANVMIEPDGRVVLMDFGLAQLELGGPGLTIEGQFAGTPYYCSPEQASGRRDDVGPPTDVFALGVTLYELLAGERPFEGGSTQAVLSAIAEREPRPLHRVVPGISLDLAAVVERAIQKDPLQRYASADAFGNDLRAVLERRPVTARRASAPQRLLRLARRKPVAAALVAVLALGAPTLSGLAGYVYASSDAIAAGEAALDQQRVEERLDRGYAQLTAGRLGEAWQTFEDLLADGEARPEALAGELLVLGELLDRRPLAAWCERWSNELSERPVLGHLSRALREGEHGDSRWLDERDGWTATDCFLAASFCLSKSHLDDSGKMAANALYLFQQAALAAPRLHHLCGLARAAAAGDSDRVLDGAVETLERRFPERAAALLTVSELLRDRAPTRALEIARRALSMAPDRIDLIVNVATAEHAIGENESAVRRLERVLERAPEHRGALGVMASIARSGDDLERARALLERAVGNAVVPLPLSATSGESLAGFGAAFLHSTPRPDLVMDLVEVLAEAGDIEQAESLLAQTRGLVPHYREPRVGISQALLHSGRTTEAIALIEPFIERGSREPLVWLMWAKIKNHEKDYPAALAAAEHAVSLDESHPQAHYVHAIVLYNLRRLEESAAVLERAIAIEPTNGMLSQMMIQVRSAERDVRGVLLEAERFAAAQFAAGDAAGAAATLTPFLKMPPARIVADIDVIGPRILAAHRRYREQADG